MNSITTEKTKQAIDILNEKGIDAWLIFVRETSAFEDPVLPLIYGIDLTWQTALLFSRNGERIAVIGHYEAEAARRTGLFTEVIPYHQSIQPDLLKVLQNLDPKTIAINYSIDDVHADGLSHGMYLLLNKLLAGTPYDDRLISAQEIIAALRGRKTPAEIGRIRQAIATTEEIYRRTFEFVRPGLTEQHVYDFMQDQMNTFKVSAAWDVANCPIVNTGPDSEVGHVGPTERQIAPGHILHLDFGVKQNDYCSDIQRVAYILRPGETQPPAPVQKGFETVKNAIEETVKKMMPGMKGVDIDQVAREYVVQAGYPEFMYATGHHLGRTAHDGAGILGPRWERYGNTPEYRLEAGHVYTVEPGVAVAGYGYVGIEEDVLVTDHGAEFLSQPQRDLILI